MSEIEIEDFLDGAAMPTDLSVSYQACFGLNIDSSSDFPGSGFLESRIVKLESRTQKLFYSTRLPGKFKDEVEWEEYSHYDGCQL